MQNLEAYQNLELQKQLAKIQIISTFQSYLKKVVSLSMAQQVILQKAGINPSQFEGMSAGSSNPLLQPTYVDPATIFGPSLALLNTSAAHSEARSMKQSAGQMLSKTGLSHPRLSAKPQQCHSPPHGYMMKNPAPQNNAYANSMLELPPLQMKKKLEYEEDELNDFFQKRVSNASTNYSVNLQEDEIDTGKKIRLDKEIQMESAAQAALKGRKRTKVICGHPWKTHHAKVLFP